MNTNNSSSPFFNWIRGAQIYRSDSRWIGGVCAGIADRLGWDRALIRVLFVILGLSGAGLLAYTVAWLLLPDAHNEILAERIIHGMWSREAVAAIIVFAIACLTSVVTFWGWATVVLLFVLIAMSDNQAKNPNNWATTPSDDSAATAQFQAQPAAGQPPYAQPPYAQPSNGQPSAYAQPQPQFPQQTQYMPQGVPVYPQVVERERIITKRRSAGSIVNLLIFGVILLGTAATYFAGQYWIGIAASDYTSWIRLGVLWFIGLTMFLFAVTLVLALAGRRSVGYGVLAGLLACVVMAIGIPAAGIITLSSDGAGTVTTKYSRIIPTDHVTWRVDKKLIKELKGGISFESDNSFHTRNVTLDLTGWKDIEGTHQWKRADGTTVESSCPTGAFHIALRGVNLKVKVPQGCTYAYRYGGIFLNGATGPSYSSYGTAGFLAGAGEDDNMNVPHAISENFKARVAQRIQQYLTTHPDMDDDDKEDLHSALSDAQNPDMDFADWLDNWADENVVDEAMGDLEHDYDVQTQKYEQAPAELLITTNTAVSTLNFEEVK